jgi:hypothetical protein
MVGYSRAEFSVQPVPNEETVDATVFESDERRSLVPNRKAVACLANAGSFQSRRPEPHHEAH